MTTVHCSPIVFQIRGQTSVNSVYMNAVLWGCLSAPLLQNITSQEAKREEAIHLLWLQHNQEKILSKHWQRLYLQMNSQVHIVKWREPVRSWDLWKNDEVQCYKKNQLSKSWSTLFSWGRQKTGAKSFFLDDKMKIPVIYILQKYNAWNRRQTHKSSCSGDILHLPVSNAISFFF